ncbi:DUF2290 domain-containing protein [Leifsonia sp. LS-T14]|uniref:DUF2290 domain-containing protein n=1 Tax=unclassified Leifsonia TaxID=2663824 RepID=UPI0035A68CB2
MKSGLVDDQELPVLRNSGNMTKVTTPNPPSSNVIRADSYDKLYTEQVGDRAFNFVMADKALVHMAYEWEGRRLVRHRLVFLPSPHFVEFQNDPDFYMREHLYADVVGVQGVAVPLRFDFDVRSDVATGLRHPPAHLTLGQYPHCRIPVSAPVTPWVFVDFLIRHFYETPDMPPLGIRTVLDRRFDQTSTVDFSELVHVLSPGSRA